MGTDQPDPYPEIDLNELIGLTPDAAVAVTEAKGVKRIRLNEVVNGTIAGAIDMALMRDRLDLVFHDGHVVYAMFPTVRSSGVWPEGHDRKQRRQGFRRQCGCPIEPAISDKSDGYV